MKIHSDTLDTFLDNAEWTRYGPICRQCHKERTDCECDLIECDHPSVTVSGDYARCDFCRELLPLPLEAD